LSAVDNCHKTWLYNLGHPVEIQSEFDSVAIESAFSTTRKRNHSTIPSWALGKAVASIDKTQRAAFSASVVSDFPFSLRLTLFGRLTSKIEINFSFSYLQSPAPYGNSSI